MLAVISHYFTFVKTHFLSELQHGREQALQQNKKTAQALLIFVALAWLCAAVLLVTGGYHSAFLSINAMGAHFSPALLHHLTSFGDGVFILSLLLLLAHRRIPLLYCILIAGVTAGIIAQLIKRSLNIERPPAVLDHNTFHLVGKALKSKSFPSGHTTTAFLTASVLMLFSDKLWQKLLLAAVAILAGLSRIWLGVHWPIDVLVGAGIGSAVGVWAWYITQKRQARISAGSIIFALSLLFIAGFVALFDKNDYHFAQWMISLIAIIGLWKATKFYFIGQGSHHSQTPIPVLQGIQDKLKSPEFVFYGFLLILTAYRIVVITQPHLTLFYDEAYYYHWSLNPDFGYYSKPPMVAWFIALSTQLFGASVTSVKLAAPLLYSATAWLVFISTRRLANSESALVAGLILLVAPIVGFNSEFITTDAPLFLFWALSLYCFIRALEQNKLLWWLSLGLACGLGMLSKYTMALLPASIFAYLLIDSDKRKLLLNYRPWLAAILAGLLFGLNLWWNSQHEWIAFAHTSEISQQDKNSLNLIGFIEFVLGQLFVLGPIACYMLWRVRKSLKQALSLDSELRSKVLMLICVALGILLVISLQALSSRAFINWAAPWIIGASMLIGLLCHFTNGYSKLIRLTCLSQLLLLSCFYHWPQLQSYLGIEATKRNTPYQRVLGWEEMAQQLSPYLERHPSAVLASDERDLLAYLGFHAQPGEDRLYRWNSNKDNVRDHYDLKYNLRELTGSQQDIIFVAKHPLSASQLARFEHSSYLAKLHQFVLKGKEHTVFVYYLQGFKGYE